jgi:hypothetical protein
MLVWEAALTMMLAQSRLVAYCLETDRRPVK